MPSTQYDLVPDQDHDYRIPAHDEAAFFRGITFHAKLIGWKEVPRPKERTEIVRAMRKIRQESKLTKARKRKVTIHISVDGVRVCLRKKRRKKKDWTNDADEVEVMDHPIYRIFYVSHDSSDLKIFSYIARDGDSFKCTVFKSNKKSQAMLIVRTVGQAFEVCHSGPDGQSSDVIDHDIASEQFSEDELQKKDPLPATTDLSSAQRPNHLDLIVPPPLANNNTNNLRKSPGSDGDRSPTSPMSSAKEIQQLRDMLEQQSLQTRQTVAQLTIVKEQLISETKARIDAQLRTKHLLQQNRELLEQLVSLGGYTEPNQQGLTSANIALAPQSQLQMLLQDHQSDMSSPIRKAFLSSSNNNNLPSISQHLNNLGSINQQLSTLTHQLSGLNQQSQNLQNLQNYNQSLQNLSNTFPAMNQIQSMNNNNLATQTAQDVMTQNDLYQMNQELLNRLQNLNLGMHQSASGANNNSGSSSGANQSLNNSSSPHNSFIYANPSHLQSGSSNNNFNFLNSPNSLGGNMTPSPIGTLNRNSYMNSPLDDNLGLSIDQNLNKLDDSGTQFIKPLSQVGTLTTIDQDGNVKVVVPVNNGNGSNVGRGYGESSSDPRRLNDRKLNVPNVVTLKVTDEAGNVTNTKRLSATPSFITRSTSEKLSANAKVARWFQQLPWNSASLSRPESGFVSGDSRSERNPEDNHDTKDAEELDEIDFCDEYLLVEGSRTLWTKVNAKKRKKLLRLRLGKVTTF